MHELSLAMALVEQVEEALANHTVDQVVGLTVRLGALSGVDRDAFEFAFPVAAQSSALEGAELVIEEIAVRVNCRECSLESSPDPIFIRCEECGSNQVEIIAGREFMVRTVDIREHTPAP